MKTPYGEERIKATLDDYDMCRRLAIPLLKIAVTEASPRTEALVQAGAIVGEHHFSFFQ